MEIAKYSQIPVQEIMSIGKAFAESGMFPDTRQAAQAIVKIQAGQEMGIAPFAAMTGIHIIQGKPTVGAGLIAAKVKGSGKYDYKIVEQSDIKCSIDYYQGKELIGNSTFTIEDARKAQTKNLDKFPKNMLFARAMSNGQKWFCPDVFLCAVYTPEEMENVIQDTTVEQMATPPNATVLQTEIIEPDREMILSKLIDCDNLIAITSLFKANKSTVENDADLLRAFGDKKKEVLTPQNTVA